MYHLISLHIFPRLFSSLKSMGVILGPFLNIRDVLEEVNQCRKAFYTCTNKSDIFLGKNDKLFWKVTVQS